MAFQNAEAIQKLYVAFFNRPADYYGLQYWDEVITKSGNADAVIASLAATFAQSKEYTDTYAGQNTRQIINNIYKNLFGRPAEEAGLEYWNAEVTAGRVSLSNAVLMISGGAQNADKIAYASKVTAATAFTDALDTTDERLGYAGEKANAVAKQFLSTVTDAASLATAITPANLDATVNASIGAGQTAQTFQLTKGLDNVTGSSGNDVIVGSIDSAVGSELNTLSSVDLINGGAGVDTLKVAHAKGAVTLGSLTNVEIVEITSAATTAEGGVKVNSTSTAGVTDLNIVRAAGAVEATAGVTTNVGVSLKDVAGVGSITVIGGKNVNVATTDSVSAINVGAGADADPVGSVVVSATGAAMTVGSNITMGNINVGGGTTINVTQKATVNSGALLADATAEKVTQGNVTIAAGSTTTDVTVKQDATISAKSTAAVAGIVEVATAKFTALKEKESVTVGGLTFTAAKALTAAEVAQAFANLSNSAIKPTQLGGISATSPATATGDTNGSSVAANGTFSGTMVAGWNSGAANGDTVTFTGSANANRANLENSSSAAPVVVVTTTTEGRSATAAENRLGVDAGLVTIAGAAALKNVTVDGYANNSSITGSTNAALATVTLANGENFAIGSAAATLALNLTNVDGTVSVAGTTTKTLNASVTGDDVLTTLVSASAEAVNVSGTGNVAGTTATGGLEKATAINTSAMTAGTAEFTIASGIVTSYTGGAADDSVTISNAGTAITKAVTLGAGDDSLILNGTVVVPTATLSGGEGTDTIGMNGASAAAMSANGDFAGKIDGFEKLAITDNVATATTVNMANMDGIKYVISNNSTAVGTAAVGEQQSFTLALAEQQTMVITNGTNVAVGEQQSFTVGGTASADGKVTVMGVDVTVTSGDTATAVATAIANAKTAIMTANDNVADVTANNGVVTITYTTGAGNVTPLAAATAAATGITVGATTETRAFDSNAGNITFNAGANVTIALTAGMTVDQVGQAIAAKQGDIKAANPNVDTVTYDALTKAVKVTYKGSAGDVAPFTVTDTAGVGFAANAVASQYAVQNGTITVAGTTVTTTAGQTIDQVGNTIAGTISANPNVDTVTYDSATDTVVVTYKASAGNVATNAAVVANNSGIAGGSFTETRAWVDAGNGVPSLTLDKMVNDSTLELVAGGSGVNVKMADATGTADTFNIVTKVSTVAVGNLDFGTVNVAGVETVKVNAIDTQPTVSGSASIQTATLIVNGDKATSIVASGNSTLALSLGADTKSVATVDASAMTGSLQFAANGSHVVTVTGGAAADTLRASVGTDAKADVLIGGAGNDVLYVGTNGATLTGGAGNDTFIVSAASATLGNKEGNTYSTITDFSAGDLLQLRAFVSADGVAPAAAADVSSFGKLTATLNETTATFSNFVDAAVKQAGVGAAVWFNYKGDLYVVVDSGTDTDTFQNGTDLIVKLTGINGDNLTWNSDYGTAALI